MAIATTDLSNILMLIAPSNEIMRGAGAYPPHPPPNGANMDILPAARDVRPSIASLILGELER
ncbi:MAG: hypothetical protein FJX40_05045 [Alphaproteobacteria bacterium]|jgi:hypothetical protein|nr:hypothetical protein [Alphaproteobacteria bacterium]MBM3642573.1 hypothetical protein [Alphaproteobacteria bacterium]